VVVRVDPTLTVWKQSTYFGGTDDDYACIARSTLERRRLHHRRDAVGRPSRASAGAPSQSTGRFAGFVARLDSTLTRLDRTTYYRGSGETRRCDDDSARRGEVIVAGTSTSPDLPGTACGALFRYAGGSADFGGDGFVTLFSADLSDGAEESCSSNRVPIRVGSRPGEPRTVARPAGTAGPASVERGTEGVNR
jgi:hypothetical protein